ncbi:MAG: branched-chain amino acid ABC transporter permease [Roseiarcus sp.]|jgi:branched-chain amino acid transport system permease protein
MTAASPRTPLVSSRASRWRFARAPTLLFAAALVVLPLTLPNAYYFDVAIRIAINATLAIALNLLIGYTGQISLGHAAFFGLGAYGSAILVGEFNWPPGAALVASAALVGALAYVVARVILRLEGHYLAMATLGLGVIATIALSNEVGLTGGPDGMSVPDFSIFGLRVVGEKAWYWVFAATLVAAIVLAGNLIDSPAGRALRAIHGSQTAARAVGVDASAFKTRVFVLSATAAAIMGSLYGHYEGFVTPGLAAFPKSVQLVTMVVVGGMASIWGSVLGAALLSLAPELLARFEGYETMVFGAILVATMIFLPRGIAPSLSARLWRKES